MWYVYIYIIEITNFINNISSLERVGELKEGEELKEKLITRRLREDEWAAENKRDPLIFITTDSWSFTVIKHYEFVILRFIFDFYGLMKMFTL